MSSGFIRDQYQLLDRQLALKSNANQNSEDYVFNIVKIDLNDKSTEKGLDSEKVLVNWFSRLFDVIGARWQSSERLELAYEDTVTTPCHTYDPHDVTLYGPYVHGRFL